MIPQRPIEKVAVVILNWNGLDLLRRFLPQVIANTPAELARIIVADNGSTDDSLIWIADNCPEVDVIRLDRNHGFAEGYNLAIERIGSPYTVLLNSDAAPLPHWLEPLVECLDSNPDIAACQPKILSASDQSKFEYAGACGGYLDRNGYPYCRGRIFSTVETDHGQYDNPADIDWASGAAMMVRTDLYRQAGGLPSDFFAHMEEIDLCWRFRSMGYRIASVPQSKVIHLGGASLSAASPQKTYLNFRNNLLMLHRNLPQRCRRRALLRRQLLDTLAWAQMMLTGRWNHAHALLRAHSDFRRMRRISDSRQPDNIVGNDDLSDRPNIITQYFLHRHHRFSQIPRP